MKIIALILSCLVMLLSVTPLCMDDDCLDENEINSINLEDQHEEECTDCCSPFVSCHSCSGFTLPFSLKMPGFQLVVKSALYSTFYKESNSEFSKYIWQPPQLI